MSCHGRIVILHRNGKDGPTYCLRQRICTIGRSRSCNIRMNIDRVADQHAWITVDSKNQVWIANATEGQELRVNSKTLPAGARPVQLYHSSIIYIEGRAFRFEEESMIQEKLTDKDTPENMVVEESPIKEKHPPIPESSSPKQTQDKLSSSTTKSAILSSISTTPLASSTTVIKESTPRVGVKRSLAQSFDEVEHSPAKRQRIEEPAIISRSAEIPVSTVKKSCLSPAKHTRSEPKQKTLHQVRFMLPSKLIVKPHASSENELPVKKQSSNSSSDNSRQSSKDISSSESDRAPRPSTKKSIAPPKKASKYKARYVESKSSKRSKTSQKKSDGKSSKRQSLISVILESSESESEENSRSESEEDRRKRSHNKWDKSSKKRASRDDSEESASDSDSDVRAKKKRSQSRSKHSSSTSKSKSKSKHRRAESSEDSENDSDYSSSSQSSSCSDSESSRSDRSDSERSDASDRTDCSDSESESTVEDKRRDWSDNSNNEPIKAPSNKESLSSDLSNQPVKEIATAEDLSSDSAPVHRKTSSDILREEEEAEQLSAQQQNPMANVVESKDKTDETSSFVSSQTVPIQLTLEERIDQLSSKATLDAVSSTDDLKAALIVAFRKLGCDRAYLIKEIVEHTVPLLPESYTATDPNWELKLTDTLLVITDVIPRPNALYYRLKTEFFPKISLEQKLQVMPCESDESPSSDSQSKQVHYPSPSPSINNRDSEEILIHGSYEEIFVRLRKKKALLADITKRKMEPESIKSLKRSHGLADKRDRLLCGGLSDDEVRLVLSALAELFPKVAFEFILSSLFTTAVAIILLSRRPGTHHDDILAKIGTRCVEVQPRVTGNEESFVLLPVDVQEGSRFN